MPGGRPRKIVDISTGKIGKDKIKSRKEQEEKLKLKKDQLKAPKWLSPRGKKEFKRVAKEAESIDLLDNLDLSFLAIYCNAYDCYIEITEEIQNLGNETNGINDEMIPRSKFLGMKMSKYGPYEVVHPLLTAQEKYVKQIMQCSSKLGLAVTDRLRLVVPKKEEKKENKFLQYL